jgi:hypothetical protein
MRAEFDLHSYSEMRLSVSPVSTFPSGREYFSISISYSTDSRGVFSMAVWSQKWYIVVPLILIIMGHWSLLLHGETRLSSITPLR